ncbi:MAG: Flp pilus assembly complex ATPase component TadA, partial [Candidatus Hydrogenedens sp.]|nr:Flp pilus assembly complex ATPase component TadA [Candidatus Hydrogenedens sp.]
MYIGSQSTSTILDILRIGLHEVIRATGIPSEVKITTEGCSIVVKSTDLSRKVDSMQITFNLKESTNPTELNKAFEDTRLGVRVKNEDGICRVMLPGFNWKQLPLLIPVDGVVEKFSKSSLRSRTWQLEVLAYLKTGFNINAMIEMMKAKNASDLHLRAGAKPYIRIDNDLMPLDMPPLNAEDMRELLYQLGGQEEVDMLYTERETSFQYHAAGIGYLRCSGYIKMGAPALAIRLIPEEPLPFEKLNIPEVVRDVCNKHRGLFLVCGITGSGKSTTLAAMVDYINATRSANIITIEDPIEYVYTDKKSIVSQRQVGRDTLSFANALRGSLREDPDVILVGEMRDRD